jgi:prepilin-type N-terminal cleavage/methylation domain-containing protein
MHKRGFTLVELMVALALFGLVIVMAISALLNLSKNNQFAQSSRKALDNVDFVLDDIVREARFGQTYHCDITKTSVDEARDCPTPTNSFSLTRLNTNEIVKYATSTVGGRSVITKQVISSSGVPGTVQTITSDNIDIPLLKFLVTGSSAGDTKQARVSIALRAVTKDGKASTTVNLQTTVVQRATDS